MNENIIQVNGGIAINVDVSVKNIIYVKKYIWSPSTCICENGKYLPSIMDDSVIMCDEIIEETVPTNFSENPVKGKLFVFFLHFY